MKLTIFGVILFCLFISCKGQAQDHRPAAPSQTPDLSAVIRGLAADVRKLQLTLNELQIEVQQTKVSRAEEESKQSEKARKAIATRRLELQYEIDIINSRLNEPEISLEARPQLEAQKQQLSGRAQEKLLTDESAAAKRTTELGERLESERKRLEELTYQNKLLRKGLQ